MNKKVFVRKPYDKFLYKWSPDTDVTKSTIGRIDKLKTQNYCNAVTSSQGEDWVVTYVYDTTFDGVYHRWAYVECDYVE